MKFLLITLSVLFTVCTLHAQDTVKDGWGIGSLRIDTSTWRDMKSEYGKKYKRSRETITSSQRFGIRKHGKIIEGSKVIYIIYHTYKYSSKGISIQYAKPRQRLFEGWFANDRKFLTMTRIIFEAPFSGQTTKGIQIGDSRKDVMDAYGYAFPFHHQLCYDDQGIRFDLDEKDLVVVRIVIFNKSQY
jgi:hypothetical protein